MRHGWRLLLIGVLCAGGLLPHTIASAQEGSTPEPGYIFGYRAEIVFPAAIRFVVGLNAGLDDIQSINLSVHQLSGLDRTFRVDKVRHLLVSEGIVSQFLFIWDLSDAPAPVPFETVEFEWEIETADGTVSRAKGEMMFDDSRRGAWHAAGETPLILHWMNPHLAGDVIRNEILGVYGLLTARTGLSPSYKFVIYDPAVVLCQQARETGTDELVLVVTSDEDGTAFACSPERFVSLYAMSGMTFIQRPTLGYSEIQNLLVDSMVRQTYDRLWKGTTVPAWFASGLSQLYHLRPGARALAVVRDAARTDGLYDLAGLSGPLPADANYQAAALWEGESYLLALYLADRFGAEAPFDLARGIADADGGFAGALQALTGGSEEDVWQDWYRWLYTGAAERAVEWTPYLSTTPTPTPTATDSPIPPTWTPSKVPPPTITPSTTFAGAQAPTVIVQQVTATPWSPPTNTPLPPGSLPTARPDTPEAGSDSGSDDDGVLRVALVMLGVAAAILIVIGAALSLRRR